MGATGASCGVAGCPTSGGLLPYRRHEQVSRRDGRDVVVMGKFVRNLTRTRPLAPRLVAVVVDPK